MRERERRREKAHRSKNTQHDTVYLALLRSSDYTASKVARIESEITMAIKLFLLACRVTRSQHYCDKGTVHLM